MTVKGNIVPCGKCFECKTNDRNQWSIRVQHEIKKGTFITLTYNNEHNDGNLHKDHLVKYIKRIRENYSNKHKLNKHERNHIKYFACGEYGDRFGRPHYHIIISITDNDIIKNGWTYGHTHCGRVTNSSIHYTTKYIQKNSGYKKDQIKSRTREFRLMSKGIGKTWIDKNKEWHRQNRLTYTSINGIKYGLPRYYKDKIFGTIQIHKTNESTGEITTTIIQESMKEDKILREIIDKHQVQKLERLTKLYGNLLKGDIEKNKRAKYESYYNKFISLQQLKKMKSIE